MTTRIRVLTPEHLDGEAADLVATTGTGLRNAVLAAAGASNVAPTGVSAATASTVMGRDASGRTQVQDPSANLDVTNKQFVAAQIATTLPTSQKGAASGVASLDSSSFLASAQVPTYLGRNLGSGTTLPSGRRGDTFFHTGWNGMVIHTGDNWVQVGGAEVTSRATRDTLSTTYASTLPNGFTVNQVDMGYRWRWASGGTATGTWTYTGYSDDGTPFGNGGNPATVARWTRTNLSVNSGSAPTVTGWTFDNQDVGVTVPEWISYNTSNGNWTVNDRCSVSIMVQCQSDTTVGGFSGMSLWVPGGVYGMPGATLRDQCPRGTGLTGAGFVAQHITYDGTCGKNSTIQLVVNQTTANNTPVNYQFQISFHIKPF